MPPIWDSFRRALALPSELLGRYEELIEKGSRTAWFPRAMKAAFIGLLVLFLLSLALMLFVGWAATFFVFAIPLGVALPALFAFHRRLRREVSYSKELRNLEMRGQAGDPQACFALGERYRKGHWDAPRDSNLSALWFRRAAELGHVEAMAEMGEALAWGHGVVRDAEAALMWFEKAANLGHAPSANRREALLESLGRRNPPETTED